MRNIIGNHFIRLFAVMVMMLAASSCGRFKQIGITSCDLVSISPDGLRSVDLVLKVGVHNPAAEFTVTDISGNIHDNERLIADFKGGPVTVRKKSDDTYELPCSVRLDGKISLFEVLNLMSTKDFSKYFLDFTAGFSITKGPSKKLKQKNIPVSELMNGSSFKMNLK